MIVFPLLSSQLFMIVVFSRDSGASRVSAFLLRAVSLTVCDSSLLWPGLGDIKGGGVGV